MFVVDSYRAKGIAYKATKFPIRYHTKPAAIGISGYRTTCTTPKQGFERRGPTENVKMTFTSKSVRMTSYECTR